MKHIGNVVCAIIEQDSRFLIAQTAASHSVPGKWEFPGGKVEDNESFVDAIHREVAEELGMSIAIRGRLSSSSYTYPHLSLTLIPFVCTIAAGRPKLLTHAALAWVTAVSVQGYSLLEADVPILNEYLKKVKAGPIGPALR